MANKIAGFLIGLLLFFAYPIKIQAADFVVDFSQTHGPIKYYGAGFEFGLNNPLPADSVVKPLKPQIFRDFNAVMTKSVYDRIISLGATPNVAMTDGSCPISPWPGDGGAYEPFAQRWEQCAYDRVLAAKNAGMEKKEWEVWAEPDLPAEYTPGYWPNSPYPTAQFLDLWDRTYRAVKRADPNALVVGPSTFEYKSNYLSQFLSHTAQAGTTPDIISWHELYDVFTNGYIPASLYNHAANARAIMNGYGIGDRKIEITEYIGYHDQYRPGIAVLFFSAFEENHIYGIKGNWVAGHRDNLNELIAAPSSTSVRSIWWAYKAYGDMTGELATRAVATATDGLATIDQTKREIRILVGSLYAGSKTISLTNIPNYMTGSSGKVNVLVERIPNSEASDWGAPLQVANYAAALNGNNLDITLTDFGLWDAYSIQVWNPDQNNNPASPSPSPSISPSPSPSPSLSPSPSPSPSVSPSPSPRPGDLTGDGRVDIFDYNEIVSGFGTKYTIFDYNLLVANFGR